MADDEEITEGAESGDDEVLAAGPGGGKSKAAGLLMYVAGALIAIILMIVNVGLLQQAGQSGQFRSRLIWR